ncbi:MAG TPA: shikimate kinase [Longimicrobiales bacterium]|nr:shikimate kinase [Longimicrobiales bacterium]
MTSESTVHRIVLIGFMAAGKSTVGQLVARKMGWTFHDLDEVIESREGRTVAAIFAQSGEDFFRGLEADVAEEFLKRDRVVLATGGGWAAEPGRLQAVPVGTFTVWLKVSSAEAVRRAGEGGTRPLLVGSDRLEAAAALLRQRASRYADADFEVDTEGRTAEDVSARILARVAPLTANYTA